MSAPDPSGPGPAMNPGGIGAPENPKTPERFTGPSSVLTPGRYGTPGLYGIAQQFESPGGHVAPGGGADPSGAEDLGSWLTADALADLSGAEFPDSWWTAGAPAAPGGPENPATPRDWLVPGGSATPGKYAETPSDPESPVDYERLLDNATWDYIARAWYIPTWIDYDWFPFCRALIENHWDASGVSQPQLPPSTPEYIQNKRERMIERLENGPPPHKDTGVVRIPADQVPDKDPAKGSWKHVVYAPDWTDPDYTDSHMLAPFGSWRINTTSESTYNLRPALRLEDTIRNPTDYALRFGIAPGRLDGRSRMSPTWSKTRNPMDDFENQVSQLSDSEREIAINRSRQILQARNERRAPGQDILPEVMEAMLEESGVPTNAQLKEEVEKAAKTGKSLDQMVEELKQTNPRSVRAHQVFLQNALDDQEYQRAIFSGITIDEAIQWDGHTMTNDVAIDLDNPIHPLFSRERWIDSRWKGSTATYPKIAYNLGGRREQWDMGTNDALWEAIQPTLRLVSMVLDKSPPQLEALYNMETRQPIDPEYDGRAIPLYPGLTKYVRVEDIDLNQTYIAIRFLREQYNYDWKANVLRVLFDRLELDIISGYHSNDFRTPGFVEKMEDDPFFEFSLATCEMVSEGSKNTIRINLAAETLWPLLVPQYSKSEKMTVAFCIAGTLLHEFGHAINQAQIYLCSDRSAQPPDQPGPITELLLSLQDIAWSADETGSSEPFFDDNPAHELGQDVEDSLWGYQRFPFSGLMRHYRGVLWFLSTQSYPFTPANIVRLNTVRPWAIFDRPMPLEYIEKFFRKSFWEGEFATYGFSALKMLPDNYTQPTIWSRPAALDGDIQNRVYGDAAVFVETVPNILYHSRYTVLSRYLRALAIEEVYEHQNNEWWWREVIQWEHDIPNPVGRSTTQLADHLVEAKELDTVLFVDNWMDHYQASIREETHDPNVMTSDVWYRDTFGKWFEMYGRGGRIMRGMSAADRQMHDELGKFQHTVLFYRSIKQPGVAIPLTLTAPPGYLATRLTVFRETARTMSSAAAGISALSRIPEDKDVWERLRARFDSNEEQYQQLLSTLEEIGQDESGPLDLAAKARLDRLPTGVWKPLSERLKGIAAIEYNRAPMAVRTTIDEYFEAIRSKTRIGRAATIDISQLDDTFQSLEGVGAATGESTSKIFEVNLPNLPPAQPQTGPPDAAATEPAPAPPSGSNSPFTFGVPGGPVQTRAGPDKDRLRRVLSPRSRVQKAAYQQYDRNPLATLGSEKAAQAVGGLFNEPRPLPNVSPRRKQIAKGSGRAPFQIFPNPFATRIEMTSDAVAIQEQGKLTGDATQKRTDASGRYAAPSLWRGTRRRASDASSSSGGSPKPNT
ncbi:hypothetical protein F5X98DRAFT_381780 [Xylaria grammica]|nr:hypothetical protein F5X98DRAFT_381780 [Xylaria grammica]